MSTEQTKKAATALTLSSSELEANRDLNQVGRDSPSFCFAVADNFYIFGASAYLSKAVLNRNLGASTS